MDNLTHTLVGLAAGEVVARCTRGRPNGLTESARRTTLLVVGMIGSNLPDADLLWSMAGDGLEYLLEHRGYTHTLLGCAALAALLYAATLLWLRFRKTQTSANDRGWIAFTAALSVLLHLGMDTLNSYGVHPFWPWGNRWYYGDAVFIIEPTLWIAIAPLLFVQRSRTARVLLALVLLLACGATLFVQGFAPLAWGAPVLAMLLAWYGGRRTPRTAALTAAVLLLGVTTTFLASSIAAARRLGAIANQEFPEFRTLDQVMTPVPTHPLCWDVLLVQRAEDRYVVRRGQLALGGWSPSACPRLLAGQTTAPMTQIAGADLPDMHWSGEFAMSRAALVEILGSDCEARALMQFARAPFAAEMKSSRVIGDLRFDREPGIGLAEMAVTPDREHCSYKVPWIPPRADLLAPDMPQP